MDELVRVAKLYRDKASKMNLLAHPSEAGFYERAADAVTALIPDVIDSEVTDGI